MLEKVTKDGMDFTEDILSECELLLPYRHLIYLRLLFVVKNLFISKRSYLKIL